MVILGGTGNRRAARRWGGPAAALLAVALAAAAALSGASPAVAAVPPGKALAWGSNRYGQLGDGTTTSRTSPVQVSLPAGTTVTTVAAGGYHSLALTSSGEVLAWGYNDGGQLGDGTTTTRTSPVQVNLPGGTKVTAIAAGGFHSLALTSSGEVLAWGYNGDGQLGDGTTTTRTAPVEVSLPGGTKVTAIAAGYFYSLALTSSGQVLAWGDNGTGQLGDGTTTSRSTPVTVRLPADTTVTAIAAGGYHSLALTSSGEVLAWGYNGSGQLGDGTTTTRAAPVEVNLPADSTVSAISAGGEHSLALTSSGQVLAWGYNGSGQLGDGTTIDRTAPVEVNLPGGTKVTAIAAGYFHSLALTSSGQVLAWGDNRYGQLGDGTTTNRSSPVQVRLPADTTVTAIAGAQLGSLAVAPPIAVDITKTAGAGSFAEAGTPLTYTYTVTNNGDVPLHDVTVTDSTLGTVCSFAVIPAPGSATCTARYIATPGDVTGGRISNTASAAGATPGGTTITSPQDSLTIPLSEHPAIAITKTADPGSFARAGTPLAYTYTVTNNGDVPLHDVTVTDSKLGAVCGAPFTLPLTAVRTCTGHYAAAAADVTAGAIANSAAATALTPDGTPVHGPQVALEIPREPGPAISITEKASAAAFTAPGQLVTYTYTVTNNGDVPLHDVTVTDSTLGAVCGPPFTLPAAASRTCTATYRTTPADVTAGAVTSSAAVTALTPAGTPVYGPQAALDIPREAAPAISITKKASAAAFTAPGQPLTYTYTVTNHSDVPLLNVTVNDSTLGAVCGPPFTLPAAGARTCTARYRATAADMTAGTITNTATATGTTPAGAPATGETSLTIPLLFVPVTG